MHLKTIKRINMEKPNDDEAVSLSVFDYGICFFLCCAMCVVILMRMLNNFIRFEDLYLVLSCTHNILVECVNCNLVVRDVLVGIRLAVRKHYM